MGHSIHAIGSPQDYATNERCEKLRVFLLKYAAEHDGQTPTTDLMGREIGAPVAAVNFMIARMERSGIIHVVSRSPLRVMVKTDQSVMIPDPIHDPKRYDRFLDAEATRHKLGRFIGEIEAINGRGPTLRQMMVCVGSTNVGWVHRAAEMMAEKGLIQFGNGLPTKLTPFGRQFYGFNNGETTMTDKTDKTDKPDIVLVPVKACQRRSRRSTENLMDEIGQYLAGLDDKVAPKQSQVAAVLDRSSSVINTIAREMAIKGLLEKWESGKKPGLRLTENGRLRFGPQKADETPEATQPPAEPADAPDGPENGPSVDLSEPCFTGLAITQRDYGPTLRTEPALAGVDTMELVIELGRRGYRVEKN